MEAGILCSKIQDVSTCQNLAKKQYAITQKWALKTKHIPNRWGPPTGNLYSNLQTIHYVMGNISYVHQNTKRCENLPSDSFSKGAPVRELNPLFRGGASERDARPSALLESVFLEQTKEVFHRAGKCM